MTKQDKKAIIETTKILGLMKVEKIYEINKTVWIVIHSEIHENMQLCIDLFIEETTEQFNKKCKLWYTEMTWDYYKDCRKDVIELIFKV
tara:strand:- start:1614 stop:1880 length:267 start_codon:yes stop_codon:yes gene_type:complete